MADIRPKDLPAAGAVSNTAALVIDNGVNVEKSTPLQIVDAAVPLASQAVAEAGTDNATRVSPLRVSQYISSQLGGSSLPASFLNKAQAAAVGVPGSANDLGTFTGTIIPDNQTAKQALQALETALESGTAGYPITVPRYLPVDTDGQTVFALDFTPAVTPIVYINGDRASRKLGNVDFFVTGSTLTLNQGAALNDIIEVVPNEVLLEQPFSQAVSYPAGSQGARLAQTVGVMDAPYGATGDGITNDDAARLAAEAASNSVFWPEGTYILNAAPDITKSWGPGVCMVGGNRVYLRPTGEPAQEIFAEIFGLVADGVQDDAPALQRAIDFAQSFNMPVRLPLNAQIYLATGLTMKQGRALSGDPFVYEPRIYLNGCNIFPGPGVKALSVMPRCLLANKSANGSGNIEIRGPAVFDGTKGNVNSGALKIGDNGYYCSPFNFGNVDNLLIHLFDPNAIVLDVKECRHFIFTDVTVRAGRVTDYASQAGAFLGDFLYFGCEFTGSGNIPPFEAVAETSDGGVIGAGAVVRGIRFYGCTFYGPDPTFLAKGTADIGDFWFDGHQFEGPYDGAVGGRGLDIIADGSSARYFGFFLNCCYWAGFKGPALYARAINGGYGGSIHIVSPDCAAFVISAATAIDPNCNALFAFSGVNGGITSNAQMNSITGDGATLVCNVQNSRNVAFDGGISQNFSGINSGVLFAGDSDVGRAVNNMLHIISTDVAANFGTGTQFILTPNLKVT